MSEITVCVPSIPPRARILLPRALASACRQDLVPAALSVVVDHQRCGAAVTRDKALAAVRTPLVAFLDDDDELLPIHLRRLYEHMTDTGADYVYGWYSVVGGTDPLSSWEGAPWDNAKPHQTTITTLVRTELAKESGFTHPPEPDWPADRPWSGEDYLFTLRCMNAGAKISHLPERTWLWHHDANPNTSGRPDRW